MARKNKNSYRRRQDTRLTYKEICKILGISPKQRIKLYKYLVGGETQSLDKKSSKK